MKEIKKLVKNEVVNQTSRFLYVIFA